MIRARTWAPWLTLAVIALVALAYAQSASGRRLLRDTGLVPKPDSYVAFAFASVNDLPYSAQTGATLRFPVTIENHRSNTAKFSITATGAKAATAQGKASAVVPAGATNTVTITVAMRCTVQNHTTANSLPTARVVLTLEPTGETITHTMFCRAAA